MKIRVWTVVGLVAAGALVSGLVSGLVRAEPAAAAFDFSKAGEQAGGETFSQICAVCHGAKGEGNPELKSPSLAGMPAYYLLGQLEKFRSGIRGTGEGDVQGAQMRGIALALGAEGMERVAEHIEDMNAVPTVSGLGGDAVKGKVEYAERCMACHRFNGRGEIVFGSPPLVGLPDWYLMEQLQDYRDGRRGAAEGDEAGQKMRVAADGVGDAMLRDIVAYIGELASGREPKGSIWK